MFNNNLFSDVKFVVQSADDESQSKQVIPAHKFVLSISSPVFEAMFYGELAETRDSIELPDCEYESLLEMFRFMYSDEVNLSGSNVMGVLYLAKKYMVPSLADKCTEYLQDNLNPSNVFSIFFFSFFYLFIYLFFDISLFKQKLHYISRLKKKEQRQKKRSTK